MTQRFNKHGFYTREIMESEKHITSIPIRTKITDLQPKTVETICEFYMKPEAMVHCTGLACNGKRAYFCYSPLKKKVPEYQI